MIVKDSAELKRFERKLTKELLWIYILAILKEKEMHAYALRAEINKRFNFLPGNVSAYVVLYKLESRNFVKKKRQGNKIIYSITLQGKELLKNAEKFLHQILELIK